MEPSSELTHPTGNRRMLAIKILGIFVGLTLGVGVLAFVVHPTLITGAFPELQARLALSGTRTVEGTFENRAVYQYDMFGARIVPLTHPGRLVDYGRAGGHEAVLAFFEDTRDVGVVMLGDEQRTLAMSPTVKSSLDVAMDGARVAYAEIVRTDEGAAFADVDTFYDADRWVVKTVDVASGAVTTHGIGYAPRLFTYQGVPHLLFTNGIGIRIVSLEGEPRTNIVHIFSTTGGRPAEISDDGSHIALFDATIGTYRIFRVTEIGERLTLEERFRYPGFHRVTFNGSRAVVAMPVFEANSAHYHLGSLDLAAQKTAVPVTRVLTDTFPNKLIP